MVTMRRDKVKLYVFEIMILIILFIALFVSTNLSRLALSILLLIFAVLTNTLFKRRKRIKTVSKEVTFLMIGLGLLYVGIFYLLGLFFYTFSHQSITFGIKTIANFIIPFSIIIISSEVIRFTLLSQDGRIRIRNINKDYSKFLTFIMMVLIDLIIYMGVYNLTKLNDFLALVGFIAFASISCNLYYNYYSKRFGLTGIICYRMITILYVYIIPVVPNMYIYFRSFLRMLYPYLMYLLMENTFGKVTFVEPYSAKKKNILLNASLIAFMIILTMLISCQFKYGLLVVGSESMTGTINKGDVTLFESYKNQTINRGDIIIFRYNDVKLIHRVVEISDVNGQIRYYTKGDMNKSNDDDYRLKKDIVGISKIKIKYIGIPTLWLHSLFN